MTKQIPHCTFTCTLRMIEYKIYPNFENVLEFFCTSCNAAMYHEVHLASDCQGSWMFHSTEIYVLDDKLYVKSCNKFSEMRAKLASDKSNGLPPKIIHFIVNNVDFL